MLVDLETSPRPKHGLKKSKITLPRHGLSEYWNGRTAPSEEPRHGVEVIPVQSQMARCQHRHVISTNHLLHGSTPGIRFRKLAFHKVRSNNTDRVAGPSYDSSRGNQTPEVCQTRIIKDRLLPDCNCRIRIGILHTCRVSRAFPWWTKTEEANLGDVKTNLLHTSVGYVPRLCCSLHGRVETP